MDEDPRFPNRKKKRDWDMSALDKPVGADSLASGGEPGEELDLPLTVYRVVDAQPKSKDDELKEREELYSFRQSIPESQQAKVVPPGSIPIADTPVFHAPIVEAPKPPDQGPKQGIRKLFDRQTKIFAAIGMGLGILIAAAIASLTWFASGPNGRYDLGSVDSSADGLKGHLFVEWDKTLNYRLSIEPGDPARKAAFAMAVANSPRPLSVEIHLQDTGAFTLCSKEILLKYDPRAAAVLAAPSPEPPAQTATTKAGKTDSTPAQVGPPVPPVDYSQADAKEAAREKGKDIFKNQVGTDGQVIAINAQGSMPCTAKDYEKAVIWSFTPNFPSVTEQDALLDRQNPKLLPNNETPTPAGPQSSATRKKVAAKPVQTPVTTFAIEGDDAIVDFEASRGVIETRGGKVFFLERSGGAASDPRWQDFPVEIHYRCDRFSECTLKHTGAGVLNAKLKR
jgi:hypothetical protein